MFSDGELIAMAVIFFGFIVAPIVMAIHNSRKK